MAVALKALQARAAGAGPVGNTIRLVHIVTGLSVGGAENVLLRLVGRLREEFTQHVISLTDRGAVGEKIAKLGVPVEALGLSRALPNPIAVARLAARVRRLQPSVIQTWMYHADFVGGVAARLAGVRALVWNIRNNDIAVRRASLRTKGVVALCAQLSHWMPSQIVSCSHAAVETHVELGYERQRFVVIPNGFDLMSFGPDESARRDVRAQLKIPDEAPLIGLIARYHPQKNHAMFLVAAGLLHKRRPDVQFLLAGAGVERKNPDIAEWVKKTGTGEVVHLLGEREDVPRLTAALDISSSASSWGEAFPNVLGEAMACAVPCVATDAGDAAFIVGDTGRIVPRDDPEALARAWQEILSLQRSERCVLGERARMRVAEHFEIGTMANRYATLYRSVALGRG